MQGRSPRPRHWKPALLALVILLACAAPAGAASTIWAVGNGAVTNPEGAAVANYIEGRLPFDRFLYLGDVYETGTAEEYRTVYEPTYGRFKAITSPAIGNHEWDNHATGYDPYWGPQAPHTDGGHWYSFDLGGWHFVILDASQPTVGADQVSWLEADLARYDGTCTLAVMHKPRYSADGGSRAEFESLWAELEGRAVTVLSGHDHNYQRLLPRDGIVQFVVGTGGKPLTDFNETNPWLAPSAWSETEHGALRMALEPGSAAFEWHTKEGVVRDSGSIACTPHSSLVLPPPREEPPAEEQSAVVQGPVRQEPEPAPPAATPRPASVSILSPRAGGRHSRLRTFRGRAANAAGPVVLKLVRRGPKRRVRRFEATGATTWTRTLKRRLRPGGYTLRVRVRGLDGRTADAKTRFKIAR